MNKDALKNMGFATRTIHGGYQKNEMGALATPIYQTSTFILTAQTKVENVLLEKKKVTYTQD